MTDVLSWLSDSGLMLRGGFGLFPELRIEDYVEDSTYVLRAEIPGVDPEKDLEVEVENDVLVVRGERHEGKQDKHHREFHYGSFERAVYLPSGADAEKLAATYTDGVLEVRVPIDTSISPATRRVPIQRAGK
jgi:HSP20 family molecular chaperone IbpA